MSDTSILDQYFTNTTMSLHLQAGQPLLSKVGKPGGWTLERGTHIREKTEVDTLINTLQQEISTRDDAFIEIKRSSSQVWQLGTYRIVVVTQPVANTTELTIVRPVAKLSLEEYNLSSQVVEQLTNHSKGVLIAGSPGEGKTTFAQALIEELAKQDIIIKTVESPRDLVVPNHVTQYSFSHAPHNEIRDILLLSRPDRSIYDEVRNKEDFLLYKDLRLTGIGMIGVMHATHAIDSLQRFISAVDMGTLPQVIDTVVFIKAGQVHQLLGLKQVVKTPAGMTSDDLARPVIQIHDLQTQEALYEIYSYGEAVVVIPLDEISNEGTSTSSTGIYPYAQASLESHISELIRHKVHLTIQGPNSITIYIPDSIKGRVIGRQGANIDKLQKQIGLSISVRSMQDLAQHLTGNSTSLEYTIEEHNRGKKKKLEIHLDQKYKHQDVQIMIEGHMYSFTANHDATVTIRRKKLISQILSGDIHILG